MSEIEKWLMGIVGIALTAGVGNWMRVLHSDVKSIGDKLEGLRTDLSKAVTDSAKLEERFAAQKDRLIQLEAWVGDISKRCEAVTMKYHGRQDERHSG